MTQLQTGFHPAPTTDDGAALITRGGNSDAAMLRVSVEIARQYPRDEARVLLALLKTLDDYPMFAERALYSIPYRDGERTVKVEGLTIRAAETMATAWGHMRVGVRIVGEDDNGWDLEAIAFDMQTNYWELQPARASKWLKRRDGRMELLDDRRQIMVRGAVASKLKRNCVLSVLPLHLKAAFERRVREKMAGGPLLSAADPEKTKTAIEWFQTTYQVTLPMLVAYVGKPRDLWTGQDLSDLRAVGNALQENETTVEVAFGIEPVATAAPDPATRAQVMRENLATATVAPAPAPIPTQESLPPAAPEAPKRGRGRPPKVAPAPAPVTVAEPIAVAPVASATPPPADDPVITALWAEIDACQTADQIDDLLGRLYLPGGALANASRPVKSAALTRIQAKRDTLGSH